MTARSAQGGVALLLVLVVVAIATVVTSAVAYHQHLVLARSANLMFGDQARRYVRGAEVWAGQILVAEGRRNSTDSAKDIWAVGLPPVPIDGGTISGGLQDLQGRFNLNNLGSPGEEIRTMHGDRLRRLFGAREIDEQAVEALMDWLDEDILAAGRSGAEDDYYSRLDPPYVPANGLLTHLSEMVLVRGLGHRALAALEGVVTVLPGQTRVNINTAPLPVLTMLGLDILQAERAVRARRSTPFLSVEDFVARLGLESDGFDRRGLGVASRYFELTTRVEIGGQTVRHFSLLQRSGQSDVKVLQRSLTAF